MRTRKKRAADMPPRVNFFIDSVISTPLENIEAPLSHFDWDYGKGDFHHWVDLFNHFNSFFDKHVKTRKDLQLDGDFLESDTPFPKQAVLQILRVTRIILDNCANKYLYSAQEHLALLLASTDVEITVAALQTLAALVKKPTHSNRTVRWHGDPTMNEKLFSLSQGWGGKEEGLGLVACSIEDGCGAGACLLGSTLHFEFYADADVSIGNFEAKNQQGMSGLQVIHIPEVHLNPKSDLELLKHLCDTYQVPLRLRFSLLTRLRFARAFHSVVTRRYYLCIRLLAFTVLLQSNPDHEDLAAFFVNEPEFVNELVTLLQSEENVPEDIRILAIRALAALAQDRPRQSNVLSVVSAGGHRGILPGLVQKAVVSMTSGVHDCSVAFVESLLGLVTILVSSSSGSSALREAGLIPTLLPLLKYNNPHHVDLVASAVHILEAFMDYSNPAGTLFRDLGGLDDAVARLHYEVIRVKEAGGEHCEDMDTSVKGKSVSVESNEHEKTVNHEPVLPYQQRILLKALLRAIALGTYSLDNASRLHGSEEGALPSCLSMIFKHAKKFGGGVFSLAASVMSDLINKDPTCFPALHAAGLPGAFLDSIIAGVLPSSDAVGCIPHALDALCLNQTGLQAVKDSNALHCFVDIFTSKAYVRALSGDTPGSVASGLDELMRHAPSLRDPGIDVCIKILNKIAVIGGMSEELSVPLPETGIVDTPIPMDTDLDENAVSPTKEESSSAAFFSSNEAAHENIETFLLECINNTVQLLETILQNSDTGRVFIEKKGIEALLKLFTLPGLPINFGASLTACNMCSAFRAFSSQHAANLTRILCVTLRRHLEKTLENVGSVSNLKLLDLPNEVQKTVVQDLCALECFVAVAANLVRNLGPMLIELGNAGIDIITNIGKVHRWVLWQISAADDSKVDSKQDDEPENTGEENAGINGGSDVVNRESEENRDSANTSQYINPVSSVTSHSSHWSIEPEFLPLLQMEQGPGRRARRDHGTTAHILSHVARLGRLARHARVVRADTDGLGRPVNESRSQEHSKHKSSETLIYEMMPRLAGATRGLYIAMGKAMVVPSRRRDDSVTVTPAAKSVAAALAILIHDHLSFEGCGSSSGDTMSVKCKYLGKVIEDITAVVMDTRRRTCNTVMVNTLYAHGAIKEVLTTFAFACQVLWASACLMDSEATMEDSSKPGDKAIAPSWLLNTIQCYSRLLDCLVTSSLLLTPPAMGQLLVQSATQGTIPIPKTPEALVLKMQAQVLEVVLPLWTHPMLAQTNVDLITAVSSVIMHIYSGVSDIKLQRGSGSGSTGARLIGPPPDESLISVIVEMGFSRSRAEEALRRVGTNSVEMAMEWLLNHPEEASQEEDELARALALSLGNGSGSGKEDDGTKVRQMMADEVELQLPPIENMLSVCMNLLKSFDAVAFPLTDLLVTICTRNKGQDRSRIVIYLIEHIRLCKLEESGSDFSPLSSVSHQLALLLNEDSLAREVAAGNGLVATVLGVLTDYVSAKTEGGREETPKWVATLLLVLDSMLQYRPKTGMDDEPSAKIQLEDGILDVSIPDSQQNAETRESISGKEHIKPWESILGKPSAYMTNDEQQRTMTLVCKLLQMKLPTTFMHAIFQLCARLTKVYSMAVQFLETGGLSALLSLPRSCLFPGFDSIAATIIRHLLEDPYTLQQAMESEIKHSLAATLNRHHGRVSPRTFLTLMASVILRDPAIFNQAAAAVCRIERIGDRPYVVLAKEKDKEKDREKEKAPDKEKAKTNTEEIHDTTPSSNGCKVSESLPKTGKGHKKISPSFSHVVEQLLDVILHFAPSPEDECLHSKASISNFVTPMEIDDVACRDKGKAKLEENILPEKNNMSETSASLAKVSFILKLMTEVVIMYSSAASVVLRRDAESSQGRGPIHAGSQAIGHGGLIYHVLHRLLPHSEDVGTKKLTLQEWTEKLSIKASNFLMAICVRSSEGRRRIFSEITKALTIASSKFETSSGEGSARPDKTVRSFVDFLNNVLSPQASPGSIPAPGLSTEMAKAMLDVGLVHALTMILKEIDLDHPDTPKFVNGIVKVLEALTRVAASSVDQAVTSEGADTKKEVSGSEMLEVVGNDTSNGRSSDAGPQGVLDVHSRDAVIGDSVQADLQIAIRAMQALVGDTSRYEHMDDHIRLGREAAVGVHLEVEEEFMQEADGVVGITVDFNMDHGGRDEEDEEDEEEMDGDDGDEDEDDGEEEEDADNFEEEEEAHLSLPDTDVEDHELEDEYDEDMAEEEDDDDDDVDDEDEDEDDDWRENRVIEVRWRDGLTGVSRVQVLGHTAEGNASDFPIDPFQGLSVEDLFGAFRRTSGSDQRRSSTYRPFFERTSSDHGGSFRHPLLTRPNLPTVAGSNGVTGNPLSNSSGTISRDTEVLLGGDMEVSHFYMYDGPILTGDTSNGIAESRVIASQNPSFFEFSLDPAHRFGRRRVRTDNRLSNWSDDGQPQGVAHAAAIAQALEENFIAQLGNLSSDEDRNSGQQNAVGDAPIGSTEREVIREVEGDASGRIEQASASDSHAVESGCRSGPAMDGNVSLTSTDEHPEQIPNTDLDVPMHVHITEQVGRDVELASEDSSESGATVGESLRSLEVEIGSADGHDEGERHAGTDRLNAGEVPLREVLHRRMVVEDSGRQTDDMDDTDGARLATPQAERRVEISANLCNLSDSVPGGTDANDGLGGNGPVNMSSIDPAFLEALPEDLRAEVLASQQNQAATETDHQPSIEEIDPEFLAALPPEIQAEVLAQQQAQRLLQVQQMEGQPVDMDSASIIATFPEDLREEVLLTSSESVLAALPPALLAEAQLLRERAISQYNVRTLFGDVHRTGGRRNSTASGTRGTFTSIDRGVGSGSALTSGRRISSTHIDGSKGREADGKPLVDVAALKAMLRLLRLAQPLGKGLLQRLLLNLCAHNNTRVTLVQLLLDMLRPDVQGYPFLGSSADGAPPCRLYGCQWNVVYSRPQLSDGVPPLVSRRVLEILTYLARNQSLVANSLLYFEPASSLVAESGPKKLPDKINQKGKTKLCDADMSSVASDRKSVGGEVPLSLLLKLLNQPLYLRSNTHLEQVMGLLEVVTSNAASMVESERGSPDNVAPPINNVDLEDRHDDGRSSEPSTPLPSELPDGVSGGLSSTRMEIGRSASGGTDEGSCPKGVTEASKSGFEQTVDAASVILGLATQDLCHLCLLLACEGLSEVAYSRIAEILKKIAKVAPPHRRLFITELANAAKRLSGPGINELLLLGETETVVVSTASMVGGAILRVLLALSALILEYVSKEKDHGSSLEKEREESYALIHELDTSLEPLWQALSASVGKIEEMLSSSSSATIFGVGELGGSAGISSSLPTGAPRVLPYIEAFFVLSDKLKVITPSLGQSELSIATACETKEAAGSLPSSSEMVMMSRSSSLQSRKSDERGITFPKFAERHKRLLNAFLRQNPGLLEKSLSLLLRTPKLIDFDNKRAYFRAKIRQHHEQRHYAPLRISVRRAYVLEDSYNQLRMRTPDELKGRLTVQFQGEEGIDAGGLTREWYQLLSRVIFDKGALLFTTVGNDSTFQPNPNSVYQTEHLSYFRFVGRVVAKALFDGQLLDVYFTRSFYKHILGVKVTYHDIEAVDPDFYKNLKWVLENDTSDILGLTFSMDADEEKHILYEKNEVMDYELIPGGRNIRVTEENKHEYVDLVAEHRLTTAIRPQINEFLEGFNELISKDLISIFNDKELELLISGLPEIDLDDLKANTEYTGYTVATPVVQWFWEVVRAFNQEDMARLLQFVTGTSKVPLEGFRALQGISGPQRFQIHKAYGAPDRLPSAHTCFNQLDLPEYSSKEQLEERLLLAIHEGSEGFGFG